MLFLLLKKRNDIADIAWGLGFIVVALSSLIQWWTPKLLISFYFNFRLGDKIGHSYLSKKQK